ncbi:MAG: translation initiation factor 2 [Hyphomicrobiales bacterium]
MKKLIVCGIAAVTLSGCATVTRGTTNEVSFESTPSGATVLTSLQQTCVTPCMLEVARNQSFTATFNLEGFEPRTVPVTTQVAGAGAAGMAGNLILGGVVGVVVDASTGAMNEHVPNPVIVTFGESAEPIDPAASPPAGTPAPLQTAPASAEAATS